MNKYFLAVIAIFKNEQLIIKEWIDHYLWQGVEHFYLIDNDSDDNYLEVIQPYINKGLITLYRLPEKYKQREHYNTVFNQIKNDIEWLIICDIDEYFFGLKEKLSDFIKNKDDFDYFVCNWINFGSNGYIEQPNDIRTSFTKRFFDTKKSLGGCHEKYIAKASVIDDIWVHHFFTRKENIKKLITDEVLLFHYQIMSKNYYERIKMSRGDSAANYWDNLRDWNYFYERDGNEVEDLRLSNLIKLNYNI